MGLISDAFASASRVLIVRGSTYDPKHRASQQIVADVREPTMLIDLAAALTASPTDFALMTPGDPTLVILDDRNVLLTIQCVQPGFIRLAAITEGDCRLDDPSALGRWLDQWHTTTE